MAATKKTGRKQPRQNLRKIRADLDRVFESQLEHHKAVARTTVRERRAKLKRMLSWIYAHRTDIHAALKSDFRKPEAETDLSEILVVTSEIKHAISHLGRWMAPRPADTALAFLTTSASIHFEPRGVVLIIAPWNFPFNLTMGPLVSAVAAGNCAIIKPSEFTPATSALIGRLIADLFPQNEVAMFEGDRQVSSLLLDKPFHHIFFTGSPAVGKIVQEKAAKHLATVTLELGGKSPVIVDKDVNMDDAVKKIAWGKFMNNGQTCIAPDYALVHQDSYHEFVAKMREQVRRSYGSTDTEQQESQHYARIISSKHHKRLETLLKQTVKMGATIEFGGNTDHRENYIAPTLVSGVSEESPLMKEEIFGPILPVIPVPSLQAAVDVVSRLDKPLALYVFTNKRRNADFVLAETAAGGSCVNDTLIHFLHPNLPFGGVNFSGSGNSHGYFGFRAFSHERAVLRHHGFAPMKLLYPPYTLWVRRLAGLIVRWL